MRARMWSAGVALMVAAAGSASGQTAGVLSFQGLIRDDVGVPVTGLVDFEFRIYNAPTVGMLVDMDGDGLVEDDNDVVQDQDDDEDDVTQVMAVPVANGLASTKFGPVHPTAFNGSERWLEVRIRVNPALIDDPFTTLSRLEMATAPAAAEQVNVPLTGTPAISVDENGNVGIGTTSPSDRLTVVGGRISATGTGANSGLQFAHLLLFEDTDLSLKLTSAGGYNVALMQDGNVGIGTTSPADKLHVRNDGQSASPVARFENLNNNHINNPMVTIKHGRTTSPEVAIPLEIRDGADQLVVGVKGDGSAHFQGNVGIGTTNPSGKLQVVDDNNGLRLQAKTANAVYTELVFYDSAGVRNGGLRGHTANPAGGSVADDLEIWSESGDVVVSSGSKFGIGTTSPGYPLDVNGGVNALSYFINGTSIGMPGQNFWAATGGGICYGSNVGIGTCTVPERLTVNGRAQFTNAGATLVLQPSSGGTQVGTATAHTLHLVTNGTNRISILTNGNTGVGTSPVNKLDIEGGAAIGTTYSGLNTAPSNGLLVEGNVGIGTSTVVNKLDVEGGAVVGATFAGANLAPTNGLLVQGVVGIGTSSPTAGAALDVNGTARMVGFRLGSSAQAGSVLTANSSGVGFWQLPVGMLWQTTVPDIYYDAGNVGIGTQTPGYSLDVIGATERAVSGYNNNPTGTAIGVYGQADSDVGTGVCGKASSGTGANCGVAGETVSTSAFACGVLGRTVNPTGTNYGVFSQGNMAATGLKPFHIDHPLDPANKYLNHYAAEGPEPLLIYRGNVELDANGEAWVELPEYFEAINRDFQYQLTCVGGFAPAYIAEEIRGNRFKIAGGRSGLKVSWMVSGVRNDPFVATYGAPVEQEKPVEHRGKYFHPELYGQPRELGIDWASAEQNTAARE